MSILSRLKNKLQDPPPLTETKIREFDECMSLLKNENVELHKRLDQLEAMYKTNSNIHQSHLLEEQVRELEQENGRLFAENRCQREEYESFLDQLANMVVRTAVMQDNIRKECASIYHVIERLSNSKMNAIQINYPFDVIKEARKRILNNTPKVTDEIIRSSSSSSLLTNHQSISTSDSWTLDVSEENEETKLLHPISNIPTERKQSILQRSETFVVSKNPSNGGDKDQMQSTPSIRPSRLPSRCSTSKTESTTNAASNRSLSAQKVSKLPVRTTASLNRQQVSTKKTNIPTPVVAKTRQDITDCSMPLGNSSSIKQPIRPPPVILTTSIKFRSRPMTTTDKDHTPPPRATVNVIKSNNPREPMKSTSSESSVEEQQSIEKLLPLIQDEGYSTWSSVDVMKNNIEKNDSDEQERNIDFIKTWLDTTNRQCSNIPVKEVRTEVVEKLSDTASFLCPFVRNRCSNVVSIPLASDAISFPNKDISLDSLDSSQSEEQTITSSTSFSSSSFSRSETFEKLLLTQTLANISTDLTDSTCSASSTFNMSDYIEDHFLDPDDDTSDTSSSFETTIINLNPSLKAQKRLLFPGLLNRLIFFRRVLSDSDLQRKEFYMAENENQFHVYHSNIINEHSVEVNLINTYGSESELHVWSHDCAEQRRFLNERQQNGEENQSSSNQCLAVERQILLQQIYEYPWLLQENDLDRTARFSPLAIHPSLTSPTTDLIVPLHNPDFYQLCALTDSTSFGISADPNLRHITSPTPSSVL